MKINKNILDLFLFAFCHLFLSPRCQYNRTKWNGIFISQTEGSEIRKVGRLGRLRRLGRLGRLGRF
jgi:hypothetical protein